MERERVVLYGVRVRVSHHWHFKGYARSSFWVPVHIPINVLINFPLVDSVSDDPTVDGMANEAKENPRGTGSEPPIAEAVGSLGTCKKGQVSTEGSSSRAVGT